MHVDNERDFPQANLDIELNVLFLLNEHGDLDFLSHNNSVQIVLFNLKKSKKSIERKKKDRVKACNITPYSEVQIMTMKTTTIQTLYVQVA